MSSSEIVCCSAGTKGRAFLWAPSVFLREPFEILTGRPPLMERTGEWCFAVLGRYDSDRADPSGKRLGLKPSGGWTTLSSAMEVPLRTSAG